MSQQNDGRDTRTCRNLQVSQNRICAQQISEHCRDKTGDAQIIFLLALAPHEGPDGHSEGNKSRGEKHETSNGRQGTENAPHQADERKRAQASGAVAFLLFAFAPAALKADQKPDCS